MPTSEDLRAFAESYIDRVLAIHCDEGEPCTVSQETYDSVVSGAEHAFRALAKVRERTEFAAA